MMKISFCYFFSKKNEHLTRSLELLLKINGDNIEIIFLCNSNEKNLINYVNEFNFGKKAIRWVYFFEYFGHSYSYNIAKKIATGDYIFFLDEQIIVDPNFYNEVSSYCKSNPNHDVILLNSINNNKLFDYNEILSKKDIYRYFLYKLNFINNSNILFPDFYFPSAMFFYDVMEKVSSFGFINQKIILFLSDNEYNYNLYDILKSCLELNRVINDFHDNNFEKYEFYYAYIIYLILYDFMYKICKSYSNDDIIKLAINNVSEIMENYFYDYKNNNILFKNSNNKIVNFMLNFNYKINYVKKVLEVNNE